MAIPTPRPPWYRSRPALAIAATFVYIVMWFHVLVLSFFVGLSSGTLESMVSNFFGVLFLGGLVGHGLWILAVGGLLPAPRRLERIAGLGVVTPLVAFGAILFGDPIMILVTVIAAPLLGTAWAYGPLVAGPPVAEVPGEIEPVEHSPVGP